MSINQVDRDDLIRAALYRNTERLTRVIADDEGYHDSASATVYTECAVGDQIFVSIEQGGLLDGYWSPAMFSGYLLQRF